MKFTECMDITFATSAKADGNLSFKHGEPQTVIQNRDRFLRKHGLRLDQCVIMSVEHSDKIITVTKGDSGRGALTRDDALIAEALITDIPDLVLFLLTADCFPLAFYDPAQRVIALAHLGWKPTGLRLAQKVIYALECEHGSKPADILVAFGPGIHKGSYVLDEITQRESHEWQPYLESAPDGKTAVDLIGYNTAQLFAAGIRKENVSMTEIDTVASPDHFSHYREIRTGEETGRFATILALK